MLGSPPRGEPARYALHALADVLVPSVAVVLAITGGRLSPAADVIAQLAAMVVIALAGGLVPALIWVIVAALVLVFLGIPRPGALPVAGTLDPHETPGGGLTMVVSLPAARRAERAGVPELIGAEPPG